MDGMKFWEELSAEELIAQMHARTDENGILYVPAFRVENDHRNGVRLRCKMAWDKEGAEQVLQDYATLQKQLVQFAAKSDVLDAAEEECSKTFSPELMPVWRAYLRPFETEDFDPDEILSIDQRLEILDFIRELEETQASGQALTPEELDYLRESRDITVTEAERQKLDAYHAAIFADSNRRMGDKPFAYREIIHAKRLCKLLSISAPEIILNIERRNLAKAMVLNRYCTESAIEGKAL